MIKHMFVIIIILFAAVSSRAQEEKKLTAVFSYETTDASNFGYSSLDKGLALSLAYRFTPRWEGIVSGEMSDAQKNYLDNGKHLAGSLGARYYVKESVFLTAGASVGSDINDTYTKVAYRGYLGAGVKYRGIVGQLTAFAPPTSLTIDPNQVRSINATAEFFQPIVGPLGAYAAVQGSLASFNQSGGDRAARYNAAMWKARAGVYLSFR